MILHQFYILILLLALTPPSSSHKHALLSPSLLPRGGSSITPPQTTNQQQQLDDQEGLEQKIESYNKLLKYRSDQQLLYQLRSTYLSELLASRGLPLPTVLGVSTVDGERPAERVNWDCALSTVDDPKTCLYSFDAEPNTKVLAPLGTQQYISLRALNRLRRTDPLKVEPMWHSQYAILTSWFADSSEYSLMQHVGMKGFFVSSMLNGRMVLRSVLIGVILTALVVFMPLIERVIGRVLVSAPFWSQWNTWGRIARAGFPLKLLLGQLAWKGVAGLYFKLEEGVRDYFVDLECEILEQSVPLTVGVEVEEEVEVDESADSDDEEEYDEDEY
ncbi:hypothetical protein ACHAWO_006425 [Cyclotella atomus]|uniref:Uncharacterized protein n=1 Tax=Cyclotella atomus TaxID=382360 RepID=A0ABD3P946_9STRA